MTNAFVRKLAAFADIDGEDRAWLEAVTSVFKEVAADVDLIRQGERPDVVQLILDGLAFRYKMTPDGSRQIVGFLIPGDFCDLHVAILDEMDHSIGTLTPCRVVTISRPEIEELLPKRPGLARAFWWCTLVDEAILREWLVDLGSRSAEHRIAHLFCELYARLETVSLVQDGSFELPLTQTELADTAGMSTVHVNRSLKELRTAGLVTFRGGRVVIPDVMRLMDYSAFDPAYLHRPEGKARGMLPEQGMAPLV